MKSFPTRIGLVERAFLSVPRAAPTVSSRRAKNSRHAERGAIQSRRSQSAPARAEQNRLTFDVDRLHVDLSAHFCEPRRSRRARLCPHAVREQWCVGGELFAGGPGPGAGDDDPCVIGDDDGVEMAFLAGANELIVQRNERVIAALASAILDQNHRRSVLRQRGEGQLRVLQIAPRLQDAAFAAKFVETICR